MRGFAAWLRCTLSHTRVVRSGSPPLYRMLALGSLCASVTQAFDRDSLISVTRMTPDWFDYPFIAFGIVGSLMILISLYMTDESKFDPERLNDSLNLEMIGLFIMQTLIVVNIVALVFYYGDPPSGMGSWFQVFFGLWSINRVREIRRAVRELTT